jgi:hypothetical protein
VLLVCMTKGTAGSPAVASRPAEAALCLQSRVRISSRAYHPNMAALARTSCTQQALTNMRPAPSLRLTGRDLIAPCASLPSYRWTSRGRMRGVGATCTAPKTHGLPKRMPAEIRQDRCGTSAASSPFPPNGVARLGSPDGAVFRQQLEGVSWPRATFCIVDQDPRALHGPSDQAGPGIPPGERRWDYEASSKAGSWAARADGTAIWAWDSRSEQLARRERVQA